MRHPVTVLGAPSSIGIRPYDDGRVRRLDLAPAALRDQGLVGRLAARDAGDVIPPLYREMVRSPGRVRNEVDVVAYSRALAGRLAPLVARGEFVVVLGGDCSIVLGCLLGARRPGETAPGLVYVDAHADFATPEESSTGSAAAMGLALAVGRGDSPLASLADDGPLTTPTAVALIGRRDDAEPWYGQVALAASPILDLPHDRVRRLGPAGAAGLALEPVTRPGVGGFWIHLDADVLDPAVMPAVDSPEPGGLGLDEVALLLAPLVAHPRALGLELTIYDPELDPDRVCAARLAAVVERCVGR